MCQKRPFVRAACLQNETAPKSFNFKTKNGPKNDPKLPRKILSLVLLCRISHRHSSKIFHREFPHKIKYFFTTRICRHGHANRLFIILLFAIFGGFVRNFGCVFAILLEVLLIEIKRKSIFLLVGRGGGLRGAKIVNKNFVNKLLGPAFGRTDFSRIFIFEPPDFFADFLAGFFSPHFCGKRCPEKSSRKIPGKILQNFYTTKILQHISADWPGQI